MPDVLNVFERRTKENDVRLTTVEVYRALQNFDIRPGEEDFQMKNASLAIALSSAIMARFRLATNYDMQSLPKESV
ncbi:hypothetical protein AJ80_04847 [Polytolypa hystricis UAMH7299]|uniref:Uncharacterized protein n=1 Tax=Polytolypa hystricis (strain UAMH7299) TaxID=1447883 RepID=A0A2B7Y8L1_POLH7|nr:hypothetical protein AJ80_04847 [Polytolypa hystricis UAMH7299]